MLCVRNLKRLGLGPFNFDLHAGECVSLSGPSGAGKSLLLRALADLDPNEGEVELDSVLRETVPAPEWRKRVAYLAAESGWWADTVGPHFDNEKPVRDLLPKLGLETSAFHWDVARLSTGEKQRLALIRILVGGPKVLLLDEPTSGLDPHATELAENILKAQLASGAAILLVTHDRAQAARLCQRHMTLKNGQLFEDTSPVGDTP